MKILRHIGTLSLLALSMPGCGGESPLPGEAELAAISPRTAQADVLAALPEGPREPGDRILHGYRLDGYFVEGAWVEVLWLESPEGLGIEGEPRQSLNPVIFYQGGLDGWGWDHFDERAGEWGIQPLEGMDGGTGEPTTEDTSITI